MGIKEKIQSLQEGKSSFGQEIVRAEDRFKSSQAYRDLLELKELTGDSNAAVRVGIGLDRQTGKPYGVGFLTWGKQTEYKQNYGGVSEEITLKGVKISERDYTSDPNLGAEKLARQYIEESKKEKGRIDSKDGKVNLYFWAMR